MDGQWAVGRQEWPGVLVEPHGQTRRGNKCRYYVPYGGGLVVDGQWAVGRQEWPGVLVKPHGQTHR